MPYEGEPLPGEQRSDMPIPWFVAVINGHRVEWYGAVPDDEELAQLGYAN